MIGVSHSDLPARTRRLPGSPLALQVAALMLGGLVVAQLVTLFLTLMLPPAPDPEYRLGDIASALKGSSVHPRGGRPLVRTIRANPPGADSPGWLVSQQSQHELAKLLGTGDADVRLMFYTPLPFAGSAMHVLPQHSAMIDRPLRLAQVVDLAQLAPPPLPSFNPAAPPGGSRSLPPDVTMPGRAMPGAPLPADMAGSRMPRPPRDGRGFDSARGGVPSIGALPPGAVVMEGQIPLGRDTRPARGNLAPPELPSARESRQNDLSSSQLQSGQETDTPPPQTLRTFAPDAVRGLPPSAMPPALAFPRIPMIEPAHVAPSVTNVQVVPASQRERAPIVAAPLAAPELARPTAQPLPLPAVIVPQALAAPPANAQPRPVADGPEPQPARGLFGLAPVPFVQGDFVAAMRIDAARWAVVQPQPEPFPNSWQRRVLLWFALSFAIVAPLGLLFTRRLIKPLQGFADAAEQLGRDPSGPVMTLAGPAEIGRAARAFNQMQGRLRRFVDDRTAMIGAISHDLRTPLTRMRFRLEEAPDHVRDGMLEEVAQMEEMITSVLHFIRDASEPGSRETMDMRSILASVVDGANLTGGDVVLEPGESALVDIDALGMKRVLANLVDNALKYGEAARIRLRIEQGDAVAEVIDEGPGLPEGELERVFRPFYRSPATRPAETSGMGLGLAACRSITRAHGGDVRLRRSDDGLIAEVRLPLAEVPA